MFKLIMSFFYGDKIFTPETNLFYKIYKWSSGLYTLVSLRKFIGCFVFGIIGIFFLIFIDNKFYSIPILTIAIICFCLQIEELIIFSFDTKAELPSYIRTVKVCTFIRKFVSQCGKALSRKDWKKIKARDFSLYHTLLCDECNHCCYIYSLEIAKIIPDSIVIWGAGKDPFKKEKSYIAHAVILRNGYIYDSNLRQSIKYLDFIRLYDFIVYKQWNYEKYSQRDFRNLERPGFRKWCEKNKVLTYELF